MKKIISLLFLSIIFSNCLEKDVNYDLPFEQKPVAIGFLDSVNGARVFVGKNATILTKDSSIVKGVTISLWAENTFVENLTFLEKNVFISASKFKPLPNKNYYFKALTPLSKDSLISEKINLPTIVPIKKAYYQYINNQKTRVNIYVDIQDPTGFNGYAFTVQRFNKDTLFGEEIKGNPLFIPFDGILTNDREFEGNSHTFVIENVNVEEYINKRFIPMDRVRITLFNLSKPTYDLFLSFRTPEPGIGDPFFEPTTLSNKLKNGLGIFGTYSSYSFDVLLK